MFCGQTAELSLVVRIVTIVLRRSVTWDGAPLYQFSEFCGQCINWNVLLVRLVSLCSLDANLCLVVISSSNALLR